VPAPSFAPILPEAIVVDEGEDKTSQQESATSGVKLELVDDPLLANVEPLSDLGFLQQLVTQSREKSE